MEYSFDDQAPIKIHPKCVFIATANLGSQYTGTHKLDRALIDRFMLIEVDALEKAELVHILTYHYPSITAVKRTKLIDCFVNINLAHAQFNISFNLSLRHLKMITAMVEDGFTIYDSYYAVCKGIGGTEGLKSLESILNSSKVDG